MKTQTQLKKEYQEQQELGEFITELKKEFAHIQGKKAKKVSLMLNESTGETRYYEEIERM